MSFASDTKSELCRVRHEKDSCALAECYGALLFGHTFSPSEIRIVTSNPDFAARISTLLRRSFGFSFETNSSPGASGRQSLLIRDPSRILQIFDRFGISPRYTLSHHINLAVLEEEACRPSFLRGAFLAGGSVTDPEKHFHLEFSTSHRSVSREACSLLSELGFSAHESDRKNNSLLYLKKADPIADLLTLLGAPSAAMTVMTAKVEKEMRNTITRRVNCDSANADKIVSAAQEQIEAIHRFASVFGLDALPEVLKDTALLRITNPDASLSDLALLSIPPVSKSCLSHRLKKIQELADAADNPSPPSNGYEELT
jgi:hypothetical protein